MSSPADFIDLRRLLAAQALRTFEGLKLYRPMPMQQRFHDSMAPERIYRGSNRAGKTLAAAAEVAMAVTGSHPTPGKYPKTNGICYCIGRSGREIAQKIWPSIGKAGAFRMIRDLKTKEWRSYDPDSADDKHRKKESKPAPAFIPKRLIKSIAWYSKKEGWPKLVTLTNGWIIHFYSSEGKPTQGTDIDLVWFDEEVTDPDWYSECAARLVDRRGRFFWSATPQAGTEKLYSLHLRAEKEEEEKTWPRTIEEFYATIDDNKHISKQDKFTFAQKFADDEQGFAVRLRGEFALLSGRVYSEFSQHHHVIDPPVGGIPKHWTFYASVDPGITRCAVVFAAVSPPEEGDFCHIFDELYVKDCTVDKFGDGMREKTHGFDFQVFLIDMNEGRKRDHTGKMTWQQYSDALRDRNVSSRLTGSEFVPGNDNVSAGIQAVKHWLRLRKDGTPKIQIYSHCKHFIDEIKHYRNQRDPNDKTGNTFLDKPIKKNDHLQDACRYLVQYGPVWVQQRHATKVSGPYAFLMRERAKERRLSGSSIMLGPGSNHGTSD